MQTNSNVLVASGQRKLSVGKEIYGVDITEDLMKSCSSSLFVPCGVAIIFKGFICVLVVSQ